MFTPEEQQLQICVLKSDLGEIEDELLSAQRLTLPELDEKYNKKRRKTLSYLKNIRPIDDETERLRLENVTLTAQHMQLKRHIVEITENLKTDREERIKIAESLKQEEQEMETAIRKYEDSLQEKAERFRKTHRYYNEEEVNTEIDKVNSVITELLDRMSKIQSAVDKKKAQRDAMQPDVPENFLEQFGKVELNGKLKSLTEKYERLEEEKNTIMK